MRLTHSELNYAPAKHVRHAFGLTEGELINMIVAGKVQMYRRFKDPLVILDSLGTAMYGDRDTMVMKRWGHDYESIEKKFKKMVKKLHTFPRCFFKVEGDVPQGHYRVFHKGRALKVLVYVLDGYVRCLCYNRDKEEELEEIYCALVDNRIEWEE